MASLALEATETHLLHKIHIGKTAKLKIKIKEKF